MGISCNSPRIRRGFLVIQLSTARLPRPLRGLAMTNLRTGAVGGAISGRHCPSERAIVKTATAPDLSLRGGRRPTWQSREGTSSSYKVPIKTYQPIASVAALTAQPLAALPPYGCGVPLAGSERLAGWQVIEWLRRPRNAPRFVIPRSEATWESRGGSCAFADGFPTIRPSTARLPRRLRLLAMTRQGNTAVHQRPSAVELPRTGRSVSALQAGNIQGMYFMA